MKDDNKKGRKTQDKLIKAHVQAFNAVSNVLNDKVLKNMEILRLNDLKNIYITELERSEFKNEKFRGGKLKKKIETHANFSDTVSFVKHDAGSKGSVISYLVYSRKRNLASAIKNSYKLGSMDTLKECAMTIRQPVFKAQKEQAQLC